MFQQYQTGPSTYTTVQGLSVREEGRPPHIGSPGSYKRSKEPVTSTQIGTCLQHQASGHAVRVPVRSAARSPLRLPADLAARALLLRERLVELPRAAREARELPGERAAALRRLLLRGADLAPRPGEQSAIAGAPGCVVLERVSPSSFW